MNHFGRVIRLALRYRLTFALALITALAVGVLWGANIGTVYPFMKVAFQNQPLGPWVDREIADSLKTVKSKAAEIERLQSELKQAPADEHRAIRNKIRLAEDRIAAEQDALESAKHRATGLRADHLVDAADGFDLDLDLEVAFNSRDGIDLQYFAHIQAVRARESKWKGENSKKRQSPTIRP